MPEIIHLYRCYRCHFEIQVTIAQNYTCPICGVAHKMGYVTSRPRQ